LHSGELQPPSDHYLAVPQTEPHSSNLTLLLLPALHSLPRWKDPSFGGNQTTARGIYAPPTPGTSPSRTTPVTSITLLPSAPIISRRPLSNSDSTRSAFQTSSEINLPFLCCTFRQFVLTVLFLDEAHKDFFPDKFQPFVASVLSKNLSPTSIMGEDAEQIGEASPKSTRKKLLTKAERSISILPSSGTKLVGPKQIVRLSQADLNRLEAIARNRLAREYKSQDAPDGNVTPGLWCQRVVLEVESTMCVSCITIRPCGYILRFQEFIIRTRRRGRPDVFVGCRYEDFKTLANEVRRRDPHFALDAHFHLVA